MHLTAKNLLLISSLCYVVPFVLGFLMYNFIFVPTEPIPVEEFPAHVDAVDFLSVAGGWVGFVAFVLALINWKK